VGECTNKTITCKVMATWLHYDGWTENSPSSPLVSYIVTAVFGLTVRVCWYRH